MKGVSITTVHYAHIRITVQGRKKEDYYETEEVENIARDVVDSLYIEDAYPIPNVGVDPDFCCNALTEVGFYGNDLTAVSAAAFKLAREIELNPRYKLFEI
mgnify:FL=1|tara:strand:+ start:55 stop:357 length:303 start_codon:yes stop_codon:yes gene_type:complete